MRFLRLLSRRLLFLGCFSLLGSSLVEPASAQVVQEELSEKLSEKLTEESPAESSSTVAEKAPVAVSISQLIALLGADDYLLRQQAESQLLRRGADVYAELQKASKHADLEIATRAKYLLAKIKIEWLRPTDSSQARRIMSSYGQSDRQNRLVKVAQLAALKNEQGFGPLCRIARYESRSAGHVARAAALAIFQQGFISTERREAAIKVLNNEMGDGTKVPIVWIRLYVDQLQAPEKIDPRWLNLIDAEVAAQQTGKAEKLETLEQVQALIFGYMELCDSLSDAQGIVSGLQRRYDFWKQIKAERSSLLLLYRSGYRGSYDRSMSPCLVASIEWLEKHEQWEALELFEEMYADKIKENRVLLYYLALSRFIQDRPEAAEAFAKRALQIEESESEKRNLIALSLAGKGRHDWAELEWQHVIDNGAVTDYQAVKARVAMSEFRLHDRQQDKAAADLLTESLDALKKDPVAKAEWETQEGQDMYARKGLQGVQLKRDFFLAYDCQSRGDFEGQRKYLEKVYRGDKENADIFIAMFHMQEAPKSYRQQSLRRLQTIKRKLKNKITQQKLTSSAEANEKATLAQDLNHRAWLISNTEGDFEEAVRHSEKSLKLVPGSPAFLDTLGRCYYAAGKYEQAREVQLQAVAKYPHMMVMQRQLKMIEAKLAGDDE